MRNFGHEYTRMAADNGIRQITMSNIAVLKNNEQKVGVFHGTIYRTGKTHFLVSESEDV